MTLPSLKLVHKQHELALANGDNYSLGQGFVPPALNTDVQIAEGTSASSYNTGALLGTRERARVWQFPIDIFGDSEAELRQATRRLQRMLKRAGDDANPLYLEWRPSTDTPEPLWGQYGAPLRFEVLYGSLTMSDWYWNPGARSSLLEDNLLTLNIKPYALGSMQRLASATGGIVEDVIGTVDGGSRGLIIPEATTNKMTNPAFGHGTYNNGWSAAANIIDSQNTDSEYLLFELSSVKLTASAATSNTYTQSINVGNTNAHTLSCYVRRVDGGAVTSDDVQLYYGSAQTTTYNDVGDGWYRLTASVTGVASGTASGVLVKDGHTVYADGFQLEEKAYATPLCYGTALGCSWSGTAHASTSTRAAGEVKITTADAMNVDEGSIRVVWRAPFANDHPNDLYLFDEGSFIARFESSDDKFYFTDGTNTISTAAQTFSAGDVKVLHFTWGSGGLAIYVDGASAATGSAFDPPTLTTYLYISSSTASVLGYGPFLDFTTFDEALTADEALNDYTNITQIVSDGSQLMPIPYLWTEDGDDQLDNALDSSRENYCVVAGVAGDVPALTRWDFTPSTKNTAFWILQSHVPYGTWVAPNAQWYFDFDGTVDASSSSGEYASATGTTGAITGVPDRPDLFDDDTYFFVRAALSATATITWTARAGLSLDTALYTSPSRAVAMDTTMRVFYFGAVNIPARDLVDCNDDYIQAQMLWQTAGPSYTMRYDILLALNGRVSKLIEVPGSSTSWDSLVIEDYRALGVDGTTPAVEYTLIGEPPDVTPGQQNVVFVISGDDGEGWSINSTVDLILYSTPRWGVL